MVTDTLDGPHFDLPRPPPEPKPGWAPRARASCTYTPPDPGAARRVLGPWLHHPAVLALLERFGSPAP